MNFSYVVVFAALNNSANAFVATNPSLQNLSRLSQHRSQVAQLHSKQKDDNYDYLNNHESSVSINRRKSTPTIFRHVKRTAISFLAAATPILLSTPQQATAAAPVTPIKNFKPPDSKAIALKKINDERNREKMKEEMAYQIKCDEIEETKGKAARIAYEKEVEQDKIQKAEQRASDRLRLLYSLIDKGMCPFVDVEGERQLYLFDHGIDLNKVPATTQQKEMMNLMRDRQKKLSQRREKERFIVKCIVDDQKLQGNDPLDYLKENQLKTKEVMNMKDRQLDAVANKYKELIATQGSLSGIMAEKPFETTFSVGGNDGKLAIRGGGDEITDEEAALALAVETALQQDAESEVDEIEGGAEPTEIHSNEIANGLESHGDEEINSNAEIAAVDESSKLNIKSSIPVVPIVSVIGAAGGLAFVQKSGASKKKKELEKELERKLNLEALMRKEESKQEEEEENHGQEELIKLIQRNAVRKPEKPIVHSEEDEDSPDVDAEGGNDSASIPSASEESVQESGTKNDDDENDTPPSPLRRPAISPPN